MFYPGIGNNLYIQMLFAGTIPKEATQDYSNGKNDLYSAKAARFAITIDRQSMSKGYTWGWSKNY